MTYNRRMKARELIEKWKSEGVSDEIIKKRLIVLTRQAQQTGDINKPVDLEETQESEITQTQLSVPQLTFAKELLHPPEQKSHIKFIIWSLLGMNLLVILTLLYLTLSWANKMGSLQNQLNDIQEEIKTLKKKDS
jgi:hypothetical protein